MGPPKGAASQLPARHQPRGKRAAAAPPPERKRDLKRKREADDLAGLVARVAALETSDAALAAGNGGVGSFADLPLSAATAAGLAASHFKTLTDVQRRAIPPALQGHDVLGAAKTGSGKTLAFLVPLLEALHRARWTEHDGLGALVLAPTRELAIQIFEVLRRIGRKHAFSAGLVIGGKSVRDEAERLARINILVSTPGRILQHLDQTAMFDVSGLRVLVLDEADRIMDLGFQPTLDAILDHLPSEGRQTLLFSATQTRKVADLARLSLRDPKYVAVHQDAAAATPAKLQQNYVVTRLPDKLDTLWGFVRANVKAKTLVFASSGKQVRFIYEAFRHLQPGVPLLHLHGRQRQTARLEIVTRFAKATTACLFATDVAARGLDFPAVDWVVQLDCPEDTDTYIHRVGRTARFEKEGRAVLFLDPSEAPAMIENLRKKKVPIEEIRVRQKKQLSIKNQLQSMCFRDPELKYLGQKAVISYAKSINVQKDKTVFKIDELPFDEYAASLGLPGAPRIKFRKGEDMKAIKNASRAAIESSPEEDDQVIGSDGDGTTKAKSKPKKEVRTKYDRMFERRNQDVLAPHYASMVGEEGGQGQPTPAAAAADDDELDFLTVKRRLSFSPAGASGSDNEATGDGDNEEMRKLARKGQDPLLIDSKRREKLLKSKKKLLKYKEHGHKLVFDDEGNAHEVYELRDEDSFAAEGAPDELRRRFVADEQQSMAVVDDVDKELARDKRRAKMAKRKERERAEKEADAGAGAVLAPFEGDGEEGGFDGLEDEENGYDDGRASDGSDGSASGSEVEAPPKKKWFQQDSDDEGRAAKKRRAVPEQAETLEDLEKLAASYL